MDAFPEQEHGSLAPARRRISLVFPREHGAWAMLLVPYLAGFSVGLDLRGDLAAIGAGLLGLIGIMLLHLGRPSLLRLVKRRIIGGAFGEDALQLVAGSLILLMPGVAIFLLLGAVGGYAGIFWLGMGAAALIAPYASFSLRRRDRTAMAEFTAVLLLTMSAALGFYLGNGAFATEALWLWMLSGLYFAASIFVVKARLRGSTRRGPFTARGRLGLGYKVLTYLASMVGVVVAMAIAGMAPEAVVLAYIPAIIWSLISIVRIGSEFRATQEGITQTVLALWFLLALVGAFIMDGDEAGRHWRPAGCSYFTIVSIDEPR